MELMQASHQWAKRPDDERFLTLHDMHEHFVEIRNQSQGLVVPTRKLVAHPASDNKGLVLCGPKGNEFAPTNWAFGQVANVSEAPARYLRTLPAPIAADCVNYGLQFKAPISEVGILLQQNGDSVLRAVTGPKYGRIWNADIIASLHERFGDGLTGDWRVPGEFGKQVEITKQNTTLYAGDRDMFVFLADEDRRITIPNRRGGKSGSLARGFFVQNSEVGAATFAISTFLFDYTCSNRIVWGAQNFQEIRMRHTVSAPDRFLEEMKPALISYAESSSKGIVEGVRLAQESRLEDKLDDFLAKRFGSRTVATLKSIHEKEEGRPIESVWDVTVAATAYAREIPFQNERVEIEREAGKILETVMK